MPLAGLARSKPARFGLLEYRPSAPRKRVVRSQVKRVSEPRRVQLTIIETRRVLEACRARSALNEDQCVAEGRRTATEAERAR